MSGAVIWFTGLPASGKTTLARAVKRELDARGVGNCLLDSDEVREALRPQPTYDAAGRNSFYETLTSLAALLARQGFVVLVAATAHCAAFRERARAAAPRFVEVYVDTPLWECELRDPKEIYRRARAGEVENVPGIHVSFEPPKHPAVVAKGGSSNEAVESVVSAILAEGDGAAVSAAD